HDGDELADGELDVHPPDGLHRDPVGTVNLHQLGRPQQATRGVWGGGTPPGSGGSGGSPPRASRASTRPIPTHTSSSWHPHTSSSWHLSSQSRSACRCRTAPSIRSRATVSAWSVSASSSVRLRIMPR